MQGDSGAGRDARPGLSLLPRSNSAFRSAVFQILFLVVLLVLLAAAIADLRANMEARGIPTGFGFWDEIAGFDINQSLIAYSSRSTYGRAFLVGLLNTGLAAALGLAVATPVGFVVGIARLSGNWLVRQLAGVYVEGLRNVPLLLQLLFWYNAVLKTLPAPRQSIALPFDIFLNNRGLYLPQPGLEASAAQVAVALGVGALLGYLVARVSRETWLGSVGPLRWVVTALVVIAPPVMVAFVVGPPLTFATPHLQGFNYVGGLRLLPELVTLVLGLGLYTAAFIAETVRAGIESVPKGQTEAAAALGLPRGPTLRFVIVPQAMRVIVPLLTSQYVNLVKNSSLAVFVGYPDLVQVFAGTVLNQTGAAVQIVFITMAVYLTVSLLTSLAMNLYQRRFRTEH